LESLAAVCSCPSSGNYLESVLNVLLMSGVGFIEDMEMLGFLAVLEKWSSRVW
jgi:hypothetical protein